jgi:hypothetical protein
VVGRKNVVIEERNVALAKSNEDLESERGRVVEASEKLTSSNDMLAEVNDSFAKIVETALLTFSQELSVLRAGITRDISLAKTTDLGGWRNVLLGFSRLRNVLGEGHSLERVYLAVMGTLESVDAVIHQLRGETEEAREIFDVCLDYYEEAWALAREAADAYLIEKTVTARNFAEAIGASMAIARPEDVDPDLLDRAHRLARYALHHAPPALEVERRSIVQLIEMTARRLGVELSDDDATKPPR